ncbi:recombinase family protein [Dankookia rubra]|uniref:Recombinase family protein n=1 Tax=Dankookia rubra TaxID=1442381 RepID=A0A4R5Q7F6_9PROT|nr:recombinase family protein [Dankookia rubra]
MPPAWRGAGCCPPRSDHQVAHTLSGLLEEGCAIPAADTPDADDLMRIYAAMAQKERELISERTRAALRAAKARGAVLGGDRGYRPAGGPQRCGSRPGAAACCGAGSASAGVGDRAAAGRGHHRPGGDRADANGAKGADTAGRHRMDPHDGGAGGDLTASF